MNGGDALAAAVLAVIAALASYAAAGVGRISPARAGELADAGRRGGRSLVAVLAHPTRALTLLAALRVAATLAATVLATLALGRRSAPAVVVLILIVLAIGYVGIEVAAAGLGARHPERTALASAVVVRPLLVLARPIAVPLSRLVAAVEGRRGDGVMTSAAELRQMVDLASRSQVIADDESRMIQSVFELSETLAREVMVPRPDLVVIDAERSVRSGLSLALRSGFSRIPVVGDSVDDIVGVVYLKDLTRHVVSAADGGDSARVADVMRPAVFVPESKPVDELLADMQAGRTHVAIVIDEYGGTAGLVTIEDIVEELVGDIADEYDTSAPEVVELDDGRLRIDARMSVYDLDERLGTSFESMGAETVAGLLARLIGRVPIAGASASSDGWTFEAERALGRRHRIGTILVSRTPEENDEPAAL